MTSKISFRKMVMSETKQRTWLGILTLVMSVFLIPVMYGMNLASVKMTELNNLKYGTTPFGEHDLIGYLESAASGSVGTGNVFVMAGIIIIAVSAAFAGYAYLYSKEKTDFYHSLAVGRQKLFSSIYISGALLAIVPFVLCQLVAVFVVPVFFGYLRPETIAIGMVGMGYFVLAFMAVYSVCVIAIQLTGRFTIGFMMCAFILLYGPVCSRILESLILRFFSTIYISDVNTAGRLLSPVTAMLLGGNGTASYEIWLVLLAYFAAAFVIGLILCRYRASETAGRAFAWSKTIMVIKILTALPGGLILGRLFCYIGGDYSNLSVSYIILSTVSAALICIVMDLVVYLDPKRIMKHWKSSIVGTCIVMLSAVFFVFDPFGVDTWIPAKEDVEEMSIYGYDDIVSSVLGRSGYGNDNEIAGKLANGYVQSIDSLYELAKTGAENVETYKADMYELNERIETIIVSFKLKNGSTAQRMYNVSFDAYESAIEKAAENREFREKYYTTVQSDLSRIDTIQLSGWPYGDMLTEIISLNKEQVQELSEALKEDALECGYKELKAEAPIALLNMYKNYNTVSSSEEMTYESEYGSGAEYIGSDGAIDDIQVYIYPQYTRTLAVIEKLTGLTEADMSKPVSVKSISISSNYNYWIGENYPEYSEKLFTFTDENDISELLGIIKRYRDTETYDNDILNANIEVDNGITYCYFKVEDMAKFFSLLKNAEVEQSAYMKG